MRNHFSKRNLLPPISFIKEYITLKSMFEGKFFQKKDDRSFQLYSYYDLLDMFFIDWDLRESFLSLGELMNSLQISDEYLKKDVSGNKLFLYVEFVLNGIDYVKEKAGDAFSVNKNTTFEKIVRENIDCLLERLDAKAEKQGNAWIVSYKDELATALSILQPGLATIVSEYLKKENKENLERQREILSSLSNKLEPHEQSLNDNGFRQLCSDATFLLNKAGIRHAPSPNDRIESQFLAMDCSERIKWYNRTFKTILACMAVIPYLDFKDEIKEIKRNN